MMVVLPHCPSEENRPVVTDGAERAFLALQEKGWVIEELKWQNEESRILRFSARKGSSGVHIRCREVDFAHKLLVLFGLML